MKQSFNFLFVFLVAAVGGAYAQTSDDPETRLPFTWPFSKSSIWNQPIGSGAVYAPANFEAAGDVGVDVVHVLQPAADDPTYPVYNTVAFDSARCGGDIYLDFDLQVPRDWTVPDVGEDNPFGLTPNSSFALVSTDGQTVYQGQVIARCEADGPVYLPEWMKFPGNRPQVNLKSDGFEAGTGHGASAMSTLGGTVRLGELVDDAPIRHAVKINPWAAKYLYYSEAIPGFKWPAKKADGYAGDSTRDIRYNRFGDADPNILMGSLFAIPPGVTAESLGLTSKPARKLFYALQNFGMYFVEDAAYDTWDIVTERGVATEFEQAYGYSMSSEGWKEELNKLMEALSVVVNNGPESVGGGGEPIAPLAPDFKINYLEAVGPVEDLTNGLRFDYYEGTWEVMPDFSTLVPVRSGVVDRFDLSVSGARFDDFAINFSGYIDIPEDREYIFYTNSDDGSQLFIDDQLVVDNDGPHGPQEREGYVGLRQGLHMFRVSYTELGGGETLEVSYATADDPVATKQMLPFDQLYYQIQYRPADDPSNTASGLNYRYYEDEGWTQLPDFSTLPVVKSGVVNTFNLGVRPPERPDNFAFEYEGFVEVPVSGRYAFYTASDDGSQLFIGDQLVVDNDGAHGLEERTGTIALAAGKHALRVAYFDATEFEALTVSYRLLDDPAAAKQEIPNEALSRALPTAAVKPVLENGGKVVANGDGTYTAWFGYASQNSVGVDIPVGDNNRFSPLPDRGQVTNFLPGRHRKVFSVTLAADETVVWTLVGPDGRRRTATASATNALTISARDEVKAALGQKSEAAGVRVYPNPVNEYLQVHWRESQSAPLNIRIFNQQGQLVAERTISAQAGRTVTLRDVALPSGVYQAVLVSQRKTQTLRFIK